MTIHTRLNENGTVPPRVFGRLRRGGLVRVIRWRLPYTHVPGKQNRFFLPRYPRRARPAVCVNTYDIMTRTTAAFVPSGKTGKSTTTVIRKRVDTMVQGRVPIVRSMYKYCIRVVQAWIQGVGWVGPGPPQIFNNNCFDFEYFRPHFYLHIFITRFYIY